MIKTILVVDDEQDCTELLRYHLQKHGYHTVIASNGQEAVAAAQKKIPDAVLLDVMMPELDGWEVCRILRALPEGMSLPIIMLTALSDDEARLKGLSLGADDHLSKPYSMRELLLKLHRLIGRQEAIRQLLHREQEQDTTMRYMVHELRNSLTAIGGLSSLALRKDEENRYLKTISTAALHAESLLSDASLLSKLESGNECLTREPVSFDAVVEEAIDVLRETARRSEVSITTGNRPHSRVLGNKTAVRQIVINLISNAIKYNRAGGTATILFSEGEETVNMSVTDDGIGIPPAEAGSIFDKLYRATGSEKIKGAGLGLYIVKQLVTAMGGEVSVISTPGSGSTFMLSLKKAGPEARTAATNERKGTMEYA